MAQLVPLLAPAPPGFTRAFGRATVFGYQRGVTVPLPGVAVTAHVPGTNTAWPDPLYLDESDTVPAVFPVATDLTGSVSLWAAEPGRVELLCASPGYGSQLVVVDLEFPPDYEDPDLATDEELADALAAHEAGLDPHPGYLTPAEGDLAYAPAAHTSALDPHPQYATDGDLTAHTTAPDPHPLYAMDSDVTAAVAAHEGKADPHPVYATDADVSALTGVYQALSQKNQANGYPGLDAGGKVPTSTLPPLAITDVFVVNTEAAMLSLTAQRGDLCVRSDLNQTYVLAAEPATVLANWVPLMGGGTAAVTSVDGRVGNVVLSDLYAPAAHTTAPDPHSQYATDADLTNHAGAADPHTVYFNLARGDARYALATALTALTTRVTTLEGQVATLNTKLTTHLHDNGTVGQIAGAATFP